MYKTTLFILVFSLILSACSADTVVNTPELPLDATEEYDWLPEIPVTPATTPAAEEITVTQTPAPENVSEPVVMTGSVTIDALNLRLGPGLSHQVLGLLNDGTNLEITGRSETGEWLQVKLANGVAGWVFAQYIRTETQISNLPVREAYGGPYPSMNPVSNPSVEYSPGLADESQNYPAILVVIKDNIAEVSVKQFPANQKVNVLLRWPGASTSLSVGKGETNSQGKAFITFSMPLNWADGAPLETGELIVEVATVIDQFSQSITIDYYR